MLPFDWFDKLNREEFWKEVDRDPPPTPKLPLPPYSDPLGKLDFPAVKSEKIGRWGFFWISLMISTGIGFILNFFSALAYPVLHGWYEAVMSAIGFYMGGGP